MLINLYKIFFLIALIGNLSLGQTIYQKDFKEFWEDINSNYAYFNEQHINWQKVKEIYTPLLANVKNENDFITFLEKVINELHNGHISLNTNLDSSNKIIPSSLDIYVKKLNNKFIITDLREGYGAVLCGLKIGMEVVKFNEQPIQNQLALFLPKYTENYNEDMCQYAISMLFAGSHNTTRKITTLESGIEKFYFPDDYIKKKNLIINYINNSTGYIKINNSLGNYDLINEFDNILDSLLKTKKIVLDLSDTPSRGNTTVARAIMGRFITKAFPYQEHEIDETPYDTKRVWVDICCT